MTFNSLYRLEARGLLDCPIVGVAFDDWSEKDLRDHARKAIETSSGRKPDPKIFNRLAKRLSYVQGDFAEADTYERLAEQIKGARSPVFYLEIPPSLFGMTIKGLYDAGLTGHARVVVEKPFGHDLASARELAAEIHQYIREDQLYRIDHFLGVMGLARSSTCASRMRCSSPSGIATASPVSRSRWRRISASPTEAASTTRWAPSGTSSSTT